DSGSTRRDRGSAHRSAQRLTPSRRRRTSNRATNGCGWSRSRTWIRYARASLRYLPARVLILLCEIEVLDHRPIQSPIRALELLQFLVDQGSGHLRGERPIGARLGRAAQGIDLRSPRFGRRALTEEVARGVAQRDADVSLSVRDCSSLRSFWSH